ncbi:MAG TPA: amidohydrolase family protein, partial [Trebonia sp.]|nr:amidohydrolase family protein [Trebonia sp.]
MLDPAAQIVSTPHPPEAYRELVRDSAVVKAVAITIALKGDPERTRARNDAVLRLARDSGGFFHAACSVHPADGTDAEAELSRVAGGGAAWIKLHPNTQRFDVADPAVEAVVRQAAALGLPVLFDAYSPWDASQPAKFADLAAAVPEARLILAHAHGPSFAQLLLYDIHARYPGYRRNVWVDLSVT